MRAVAWGCVVAGALLDVAAPLMGRAKDELDGDDIRLHRKARRTALAAAAFIVVSHRKSKPHTQGMEYLPWSPSLP